MEDLSNKKVKKTAKRKSSKEIRVSSSGRNITTPKRLQTTSSDDQPPMKKSGYSKNLRAEIERLKACAALIKTKKIEESGKKSRNTENKKTIINTTERLAKASENTADSRPPNTSNDSVEPFRPLMDTFHPEEVETKTISRVVTKAIKSTPASEKAAAVLRNVSQKTPVPKVRIPNPENVSDENLFDEVFNENLLDEVSNENLLDEVSNENPLDEVSNENPLDEVFNENLLDKVSDENVPLNFQNRVENKLEILEKMQTILIDQNKKILEILDNQLNIKGDKLNQTLYEPLKDFPMTTVAQFKEMESAGNKESRRKLYNHLQCLGGSTLRGFLHCGLGVIMTDALVTCHFSWNGERQTNKLGNTKVLNVLYHAARQCHLFPGPANKEVYKNEMIQVLRATKQRFRNAHKKLSTAGNEEKEAEQTEESIQKRISELQRILPGNSDADDEEYESDSFDNDEDFDRL